MVLGLSVGAATQVLNVPMDYPTIQEALDAAQPGARIEVAAGTYTENLVIEKDVVLVGEGKAVVQLKAANPNRPVISIVEGKAEIREITLKGGLQGIVVGPLASLVLSAARIEGNKGRGLLVLSDAVITDCEVEGDKGTGIEIWAFGSEAVIEDTEISGNGRDGIFLGRGKLELRGSKVERNALSGVEVWGFSLASLFENTIANNRDGVIVWGEAQASIEANTIKDNTRDGVLLVGKVKVEITGNEIRENSAWGIAVWTKACHGDAGSWTFNGEVTGGDNELSGNGKGDLCGVPKELRKP